MERSDAVTVVVAADDPARARLLRDALALADDIAVVGYALGPDGLDDLLRLAAPEVVLMDRALFSALRASGVDGVAPSDPSPRPACVVVCDSFTREDGIDLVRDGAHGALDARAPVAALAGAVHVAAAGGSAVATSGISTVACETIGITPREGDVLQGVLLGWSNAEIAEEIALSSETVKSHVASLMRKLACRNRVALAVRAYQMGARP
ncbi:response regulator transcription factor [Clavibacter sepedonicus]|nr:MULTISPECIES: response regulator transcription factor [Clavibacter]MBD5381364.1 response regulator transcription factor [Clavibacter sp.]OQJ47675.1 hypothetical protein B5P19_04835 [Clavibacter sepedonicus]UUK64397.1 response regulator transcription factor [Clavibacter sepedonicus]